MEAAGRDSYAVTAFADIADRSVHAAIARLTMGLSPAALAYAYLDWATHLAFSPGKRLQLVNKVARKAVRLNGYAYRCAMERGNVARCIDPLPQDQRFAGEDWHKWPYNLIYQAFLLNQQWWHNATTGIRGVSKQNESMVEFMSRQLLDMF
jgi:polyhydroxyalkanoate synthase subunit PhaC